MMARIIRFHAAPSSGPRMSKCEVVPRSINAGLFIAFGSAFVAAISRLAHC